MIGPSCTWDWKVWLLCALWGSSMAFGQDQGPVDPAAGVAPITDLPVVDLVSRLERLRPQEPTAYFILAEEVGEAAHSIAQVDLARTLYVLAFELARSRGPGYSQLAASACLGLAQLDPSDANRAWLESLAGASDPRYAQADWSRVAIGEVSDDTAFALATAMGYVRSGEGLRAAKILDNPAVMDLLNQYEAMLSTTSSSGGRLRLQRHIKAWPQCPECGNDRIVTRKNSSPPVKTLCYTCRGNPGPVLSAAELVVHLRTESRLLSGIHRSWGAQYIAGLDAPIHDPDPDELALAYGVDPAKVYWRDGVWHETPDGTSSLSPKSEAGEQNPQPDQEKTPEDSDSARTKGSERPNSN